MTLKGTFGKLGSGILKMAFPDVYNQASKFREIKSKPPLLQADPNASPLIKSITDLSSQVRFGNEVTTDSLEAQLVQNEILAKIAKDGLSGNSILDSIEDIISDVFTGLPGRRARPAAAKPNPKARPKGGGLRDPKTGRYIKGSSGVSKTVRIGGKLFKIAPIVGGAIDAYEEYEQSGDLAKAGTVGVGGATGGYGGALGGAALGSLVWPGIGTVAGAIIGGLAGGYGGAKLAGAGYDAVTRKSEKISGNVEANIVLYKVSDALTFRASEIIINAYEINGLNGSLETNLNSNYRRRALGPDAAPQSDRPYSGFWNSLADRMVGNKGSVNNLADKYTSAGRARENAENRDNSKRNNKKEDLLTNREGAFEPGFGGKIGQGLGAPRPHGQHQGVDIMMEHGSDITASADGVVIKSEAQGGWLNERYGGTSGGIVTVRYNNGITAKYLHTSDPYSKDGPIVKPGQKVKAGDVIGKSGTAANVPHVHYELYDKDGNRMDPSQYHGWREGGRIESPAERKSRQEAESKKTEGVKPVDAPVPAPKEEPKAESPKPEAEKTTAETPATGSYKVDMDRVIAAVKEKHPMASWLGDKALRERVTKEFQERNPSLKFENGKVTGPQKDIDAMSAGVKSELGVDTKDFMKPAKFGEGVFGADINSTLFGQSDDYQIPGAAKYNEAGFNPAIIEDRRNDGLWGRAKGLMSEPASKYLPDAINPFVGPDKHEQSQFWSPLAASLGAADLDIAYAAKAVPGPGNREMAEMQRLRGERDKLKKQVKKLKNDDGKNEYSGEEDKSVEQPDDSQEKDNTRSDRAIWNINSSLHEDEHAQ